MKNIALPLYFFGMAFLAFSATTCTGDSSAENISYFKGDYLCVSLSRLVEKAQATIRDSLPLPGDIDTLFGMSWLEGYVIDKENQDIVLIGKRDPQRTAYHFEDLLVNIHNVFGDSVAPFCSLDPLPENTLKLEQVLADNSLSYEEMAAAAQEAVGGQQVVVGGVPKNSRHAKVMIYADYDMKKLSQGSLKMAGIRSTPEIASTLEGSQSSMSRFWFHIQPSRGGLKFPSFRQNTGVVFINKCPVVVLTEKQQMDEDGNLSDQAKVRDEAAESFAAEMTGKYDQLALEHPLFCEMENLYRLQALLKAMRYANAFEESGINLASVFNLALQPGGELPAALPGLVNYQISSKTEEEQDGVRGVAEQFFIVAGGVSQEMQVQEKGMATDNKLLEPAKIIVKERPTPEALSWKVSFSKTKAGRRSEPSIANLNKRSDNWTLIEVKETLDGRSTFFNGKEEGHFGIDSKEQLSEYLQNSMQKKDGILFLELPQGITETDRLALQANIEIALPKAFSNVNYQRAPGLRNALFNGKVQEAKLLDAPQKVGNFWKMTFQVLLKTPRQLFQVVLEVYAHSAQALQRFAAKLTRNFADPTAVQKNTQTFPEFLIKAIRGPDGRELTIHIQQKDVGDLLLFEPPLNRIR